MLRLAWLLLAGLSLASEESRKGSLVAYWGQNSFGASDAGAGQRKERPLQDYCQDATYDVLVLSFLTKFNAEDPLGFPELNLGEHCKQTYDGTNYPKCNEVAEGIKFCQKQGKRVLLSMGGFNGDYTIANHKDADSLAYRMWGLYFGGMAEHRPFLNAVLDGIDLDIEKGPPESYAQFSTTLHNIFTNSFFNPSNRTFLVTAAPQCPFPDAHLKNTLEHGWLDMVFVQFYNNPCGLGSDQFNLATWDGWARFASVNKEAKIFIGAPASPSAASSGYLPHQDLKAIVSDAADKYPSFGGVMLWDVSQANMNLCPIEKKLFSVAISHSLKGSHNVSQPGALRPQDSRHAPKKTPNLQDMLPATLPQTMNVPKRYPNIPRQRLNSTTPTSATKIDHPKPTAKPQPTNLNQTLIKSPANETNSKSPPAIESNAKPSPPSDPKPSPAESKAKPNPISTDPKSPPSTDPKPSSNEPPSANLNPKPDAPPSEPKPPSNESKSSESPSPNPKPSPVEPAAKPAGKPDQPPSEPKPASAEPPTNDPKPSPAESADKPESHANDSKPSAEPAEKSEPPSKEEPKKSNPEQSKEPINLDQNANPDQTKQPANNPDQTKEPTNNPEQGKEPTNNPDQGKEPANSEQAKDPKEPTTPDQSKNSDQPKEPANPDQNKNKNLDQAKEPANPNQNKEPTKSDPNKESTPSEPNHPSEENKEPAHSDPPNETTDKSDPPKNPEPPTNIPQAAPEPKGPEAPPNNDS